MLKSSHTFALVLLLSINYAHLKQMEQNYDWDFLIFTQHWPVTICRQWSEKPHHTCTMPKNENAWSIHGIWPTKIGTEGPEFCNKTWKFDEKQVLPIESQLKQGWINIESETVLYSLWKHEWEKHGTCAAILDTMNSEFKYFSKGLDWLQNYTMSDILSKYNILPSDDTEYKVTDFYLPIKTKLGIEPEIQCTHMDGKQFLFELRICFTKDLQLTDCNVNDSSNNLNAYFGYKTNCIPSQGIIYPQHVNQPKRYLVQLYKLINWLQWFTL